MCIHALTCIDMHWHALTCIDNILSQHECPCTSYKTRKRLLQVEGGPWICIDLLGDPKPAHKTHKIHSQFFGLKMRLWHRVTSSDWDQIERHNISAHPTFSMTFWMTFILFLYCFYIVLICFWWSNPTLWGMCLAWRMAGVTINNGARDCWLAKSDSTNNTLHCWQTGTMKRIQAFFGSVHGGWPQQKISMWESYGSYDPSTWGFHSKSNLHQASFSEQSCQPGFTFKQLRLFQECMQNVTKFSALPSSLQAFPCQFTCCAFSSVSVSTGPATFITTQDLRLLWIAPTAEMLFENLA